MARTTPRSSPEECPVCGGAVRPGAKSCAHCGADERSGWSDEATRYDGLDLPEPAFSDDGSSALRPTNQRKTNSALRWLWWSVGLVLLGALLAGIFRR